MTSTPTPWTDANEEDGWNPCGWAVDSNLVRELERELIAATEQRDRLAEALQKLADCDWVITLPDRINGVRAIAREALQSLNQNAQDEPRR